MKVFTWIVVILVVAFGFYFILKSDGPAIEPPFRAGVLHPLDHTKGNASSTVVVMEYSDFQCPACKSYYPIFRQLVQEFGGEVLFVYRHFPLTSIHANAEFAARAAEAASHQGKFWEMHDLLFEKQTEWASAANVIPLFQNYAKLLGLDPERFNLDLRSKEVKNFVAAQKVHALKSGLQGTPTFFVNGTKIKNPSSLEEFRNVIKSALEKS